MNMTPREYQQYVQRKMKKSPLGKDVCLAFFVGGAICVLGQAILDGWMGFGRILQLIKIEVGFLFREFHTVEDILQKDVVAFLLHLSQHAQV